MKKTFAVFLALATLWALFACTRQTGQSGRGKFGKTYNLGDTGPAGGIVFYDNGLTTDDGWRYLEAAPAGTEFQAEWGPSDNVAGTKTEVGSGKQNTRLIVAALGENGKAAYLCANLNFNRHNDWFLPSKDELGLMYVNLRQKMAGGFKDEIYWSSSQNYYSKRLAWYQRFSDGDQDFYYKYDTFSVRAVRAF